MPDPWDNDSEAWQDDPTPWDQIALTVGNGVQMGASAGIKQTALVALNISVAVGQTAQVQAHFLGSFLAGVSLGNAMEYTRTQFVESLYGIYLNSEFETQVTFAPEFLSGILLEERAGVRFPWDDDTDGSATENWDEVTENGTSVESWNAVADGDGDEAWTPV